MLNVFTRKFHFELPFCFAAHSPPPSRVIFSPLCFFFWGGAGGVSRLTQKKVKTAQIRACEESEKITNEEPNRVPGRGDYEQAPPRPQTTYQDLRPMALT